jgi:glucokinase
LNGVVLLADIGGTTSRFALLGGDGRPENPVTIANDGVGSLDGAVAQAMERLSARPRFAVIAVAGPVNGDEIALTNRAWCFSLGGLRTAFGFERVVAINDFEAVAWSLAALGDDDVLPLGARRVAVAGAKAVLGPGTGLGVGALVSTDKSFSVIASEGGHVSFGAMEADEDAVFARLRADGGRRSAEGILCGPGLTRLHRAVNPDAMKLSPEMIVTQARAGGPEARATITLFVRLLGRFAGDVALTFKAEGGVYLAGGVALALRELFDESLFRKAFERHAPHNAWLARVPTALITCEEPGLLGCAAFANANLKRDPAPPTHRDDVALMRR